MIDAARELAGEAFSSGALRVFLALVLFQGFHELEHVVQVIQRYSLGVSNGNGLLGSVTDVEPLHFAYNTIYLILLAAAWVLLGFHADGPRRHGWPVFGLLTFALVFQAWHEVEHAFKLAQYFALGVNGTGGILGQGPGAVAPRFSIPLLHLAYNTLAYVPALAAFVLLMRRAWRPGRSRASAAVLHPA